MPRSTTTRRAMRDDAAKPAASLPAGAPPRLRMTIGVMGGAGPRTTRAALKAATALGAAIAKRRCILVTGACPGLPLAAADGAAQAGGMVVGISPALSLDDHVRRYHSPVEGHDVMVFTGSGLMGREVVNIRTSDIVVIVGGRSGTLGELAIAYDEGKLIGVLQGTGGITGLIPEIIRVCRKETGSKVLYDRDPARLVDRLILEFETRHYRRPSCHMGDGVPASGSRTVRDPVCGMWLDPTQAPLTSRHRGRRFWFCCSACASAFRADPAPYAEPRPAVG